MTENGHERFDPPAAAPSAPPPVLLPDDRLAVGAGEPRLVRTVLVCREVIQGQVTEWRWVFLDDGSLLELAPKGWAHYERHLILERGTALYEALVAQDGALVRFERRVRAGTWARRPVRVTIEGQTYRLRFTGTFSAQRFGEEPNLSAWRAIQADSDQNVYFGLLADTDEQSLVLGVWTTDVSLSFGRPIGQSELTIPQGS
jgi:hypothetical protein